jgi:endonuclease/exonuclease/phosphatase family metal-dependent hydrolase
MRIACFNLENLGASTGEDPDLALRLAVLRPQILRLKADILCFQEINASRTKPGLPRALHGLTALLRETPYAGYSWVATRQGRSGGYADKHNLVIVSRWKVTESQQVLNKLVPPLDYPILTAAPGRDETRSLVWNRPLLHAVIESPAAPRLHVINLHLRASLAASIPGGKESPFVWKDTAAWAEGFHIAGILRSGQALEARLLVERIFDAEPQARIVVCGDFNAEARSVPLRILRADLDDTGNGRLAERVLVPLERNLPEERCFTVIHRGRHMMLDHFLVSRPLLGAFRGMEIHNETLGDEQAAFAAIADSPESYHAPVVADFSG